MTKEQACEFVRIATMSREEIAKLNLPPVKWLTRADIDRLRDSGVYCPNCRLESVARCIWPIVAAMLVVIGIFGIYIFSPVH